MSRYHLFADVSTYPNGGMGDYRGSFATIEEARARAQAGPTDEELEKMQLERGEVTWDWAHIAEIIDGKLVRVEHAGPGWNWRKG